MRTVRQRLEQWHHDPGIQDAVCAIAPRHHEILWRTFGQNEEPGHICRQMNIPLKPATCFIDAFRSAELAIETQLKGEK